MLRPSTVTSGVRPTGNDVLIVLRRGTNSPGGRPWIQQYDSICKSASSGFSDTVIDVALAKEMAIRGTFAISTLHFRSIPGQGSRPAHAPSSFSSTAIRRRTSRLLALSRESSRADSKLHEVCPARHADSGARSAPSGTAVVGQFDPLPERQDVGGLRRHAMCL